MSECPGKDDRELTSADYPCPDCGTMVEIFSDERHQRCPKCRTRVFTEAVPSCIHWCKMARECLGDERWDKAMEQVKADAVENLRQEMRNVREVHGSGS